MTREKTIQRALHLIDGGASIEFALGDAYNAGHVAGSGVRSLTEAEKELAEGARKLGEYQALTISTHIDEAFAALVDAVRDECEVKTSDIVSKGDWRHGRD